MNSRRLMLFFTASLPIQAAMASESNVASESFFSFQHDENVFHIVPSTHSGVVVSDQAQQRIIELIDKSNGIGLENIHGFNHPVRLFQEKLDPPKLELASLSSDAVECYRRILSALPHTHPMTQMSLAGQSIAFMNLRPQTSTTDDHFTSKRGLDDLARERSSRAGVRIQEIEGYSGWKKFFDKTTPAEYDAMFKGYCRLFGDTRLQLLRSEYLSRSLELLKKGHYDEIPRVGIESLIECYGWKIETAQRYVIGRNSHMTNRILSLVRSKLANVFFIGAGHIGGPEGVVAQVSKSISR